MKRWHLVLLWFGGQFAWNLIMKAPPATDGGAVYRGLLALSQMTSGVALITTALVMVVIWKQPWKRKSLAERQQAEAEAEDIAPPDEPGTR